MPKVPVAVSERGLGGASMASIQAPTMGGNGLMQVGQGLMAVGGQANYLMHAALQAERQRQAQADKLDALNQAQGAELLSLQAEQGIDEDMRGLRDQISKQSTTSPNQWKVKINNQDGDAIDVMPDDGAKLSISNRMEKAIQDAQDNYGPLAAKMVAANLEKVSFRETTKFRDTLFSAKIDKGKSDLDGILNVLGKQGSDPHNLMRQDSINRGIDAIDSAQANGLLTASDATKRKQDFKVTTGTQYWSTRAQLDPTSVLQMADTYRKGGHLPDDLEPSQLDNVMKYAYGAMDRTRLERERTIKDNEEALKKNQQAAQDGLYARVLQRDASAVAELSGMVAAHQLTVDQADKIRTVSDSVAKEEADNPRLTALSKKELLAFSPLITKARFGNGNLDDLRESLQAKVEGGTMKAEDALTAMNQIAEAQSHLASQGAQQQNENVRHAVANLVSGLKTSGPADKFDAVSEEAQRSATELMYARLAQNPQADPWKIKDEVYKQFEPIVRERKNIAGDDKVKLDRANLLSMKQRGIITAGAYRVMSDEAESALGKAIAEGLTKSYKPPTPSFFDRFSGTFKDLEQFGSSFFSDNGE